MKKVTQRQIAHALYELVADILTGKAKIEQMECKVDTVERPGRFGGKETRPTGKQWVTLTIRRKPPRPKRYGR